MLGATWRDTFPGLRVLCYGSPCIAPLNCAPTSCSFITTVVNEGDPFAALSLGHLSDVFSAVAYFAEREEVRERVLRVSAEGGGGKEDRRFLEKTAKEVRARMNAEKHYPPGVIYELKGGEGAGLWRVPAETYKEMRVGRNSLDLGPHLPGTYEEVLEGWGGGSK